MIDSNACGSRTAESLDHQPFQVPLVLVGDDSEEIQAILSLFLRRAGWQCECVSSSQDAFEQARSGRFTALLLDLHMPEVDGEQTTRRLRDAGCTLPIIALSGSLTEEDRMRCLKAGCNDFLTKPVSEGELVACLHRWLPGRLNQSNDRLRPMSESFDAARRTFLASLPTYVGELGQTGHDLALQTDLAHRLRGAAGMFGLPELQRLAGNLEQACRDRKEADAVAAAIAALRSYLESA